MRPRLSVETDSTPYKALDWLVIANTTEKNPCILFAPGYPASIPSVVVVKWRLEKR